MGYRATDNRDITSMDISVMWSRRLREMARAAEIYACPYCPVRKTFHQETVWWDHVQAEHPDQLHRPTEDRPMDVIREELRAEARERGGTGAAAFRRKAPTRLAEREHASGPEKPTTSQPPHQERPQPQPPPGEPHHEPERRESSPSKTKPPISAGVIAIAGLSARPVHEVWLIDRRRRGNERVYRR